ncbi:GNAT family N-acetyltransferase [Roseivirga sp.]|uniref:GNAT family N-acetyltransferase n=1 Tax=Roseivirga sp. TaxID=1964215 RepID=UPI003B8D308E
MSPLSIDIKPVQTSELEELRSFGEARFRETFEDQNDPENLNAYLKSSFTLDKIGAQLKNSNCQFYFARVNDKTVGYLKLNLSESQVEIERIYIEKAYQGLKIGKALFTKALEIAKLHTAKWLWLGVWQENKKAIAFYEYLGFRTYDTRQFKLGNELQDDVLMRLPIT